MSHVPTKEPLPVAASGGGNSRSRAKGAAKSKEKDAPLFLQSVPGVAHDKQAAADRKLKKRKKPKFGGRGKIIQETAGYREFRDMWLFIMMEEVRVACDRFWQSTPERRAIEAKRKAAGFNYMTEK